MGIPFIPVKGILGSDYLKIKNGLKVIQNPYDNDEIAVVRAIRPDVAIVHGFKGTQSGYALIEKMTTSLLAIRASKRTIISVEEVVSEEELFPNHQQVLVQPIYVDALVHAPKGAYPTGCPGYYDLDDKQIQTYMKASQSQNTFDAYLQELIYSHL
jgi:glutaconate CoA-transferase subunit A